VFDARFEAHDLIARIAAVFPGPQCSTLLAGDANRLALSASLQLAAARAWCL